MSGSIAFLFLMVKDSKATDIWKRFFHGVDTRRYNIYCHTKWNPKDSFWTGCQIPIRIPTQWGDISLVKATLLLFQEALRDKSNQYFVLLSDSCIPIVDFDFLYRQLFSKGKSWIHYKKIPNRMIRYQQLEIGIRPELPWSKFYSQHQWVALQRSHVKLILSMTPKYLRYFTRVHAADEHYLVSLLQISGRLSTECYNHRITYCDWSHAKQSHPTEFRHVSDKLVTVAQSSGCFFLRKISDNCKIDSYLSYILKLPQ
jgi:hypothetical protein